MAKVKSNSNWKTNADGTLEQSDVKVYGGNDSEGVYEIEILKDSLGIILETDFFGRHAIVKSYGKCSPITQEVVKKGDILVSINNHIVLNEDFEDVLAFLSVLKESGIPRRLKFLDPLVCPLTVYEERIALKDKSKKDMYGFLRTVEYLQNERHNFALNVSDVARRDQDWVTYLKSIGGAENLKPSGSFKSSKELKLMVRRGIPAAFRPLIWKNISLSNLRQKTYPPGYYQELVSNIQYMNPKVADDIDKDLNRTFPDHEYFGGGTGRISLRRVLCCFAIHNPDVAYCQSLNFITGNILLFMEEEDSFWLLSTIIECLLPPDQYTKSMVGTYIDQAVFGHLIERHYPEMHELFVKTELQLSVVSIQWFMCLFVNTLRPEATLRIWDMFLNEGSKVLFRIAISILKLNEEKIFKCKNDISELYKVLKDIGTNIVDVDELICYAYKDYEHYCRNVSNSLFSTKNDFSFVSPWRNRLVSKIPPKLVGIGLAHLGPVVDAEESEISKSNGYGDNSPSSGVLHRTVSEPPRPILYTEYVSDNGSTSGKELKKARNRQEEYRNFSREEIRQLRLQCHPEVVARFRTMEESRIRWKEQSLAKDMAAWDNMDGITISSPGTAVDEDIVFDMDSGML